MSSEWFSSKFVRFDATNDEETKKEILTETSMKLRSLRRGELEELARNVDLARFFSELTSNDREWIGEVCNVLAILVDGLQPGEFRRRYPNEFGELSIHCESAVKILILKELAREASGFPDLRGPSQDADLVKLCTEKIGDEDSRVANLAAEVLTKIGEDERGIKLLYSGAPLRTMARLLVKNDAASFRVYGIVVGIAKSSKYGSEASADCGFLNSLVNVLDCEDTLARSNALELMSDLASDDPGLDYLERQRVLERLSDEIARADRDPLSNLLVPGLMKFFGNLAKRRPKEIVSKYPRVASALFRVIESEDDATLLGNALDTLGHVASSIEGKYALEMLDGAMPSAMRRIGDVLQRMPAELRVRALDDLALLLTVEPPSNRATDHAVSSLARSWFHLLGDDPLGIIVASCKQPFPDIRESSLRVLATISRQNWGRECILGCPGLLEFLLDRRVEAFKNCKELKHRVVANLDAAGNDRMDVETLDKIKTFVRQGPHHVDVEAAEVVTEGAR